MTRANLALEDACLGGCRVTRPEEGVSIDTGKYGDNNQARKQNSF